MMENGKMIQIFLHNGNPNGIKIASTTRNELYAVMIPRHLLCEALKEIQELQNIGVYFLVGKNDEGEAQAYIGEAEDVGVRLKDHNKEKEFWQTAIAFVSPNHQNQYNKSEVLYLENQAIALANEAQRYQMTNGNKGRPSNVPNWRQSDLKTDLELMNMLSTLLGHPVLEPFKYNESGEFFYCEGRGIKAKGEIYKDTFVVREGSKMALEPVPSFAKKHPKYVEAIQNLEKRGIIEKQEDCYLFLGPVSFPSPSAASSIVLQSPCSGKKLWKTKDGKQMREFITKS